MKIRAFTLSIVCAVQLAAWPLAVSAQGLRPGPAAVPRVAPRVIDNTPRPADYIVAIVNSEPVTNNEVRSRMARFEEQLAANNQPIPPRPEFMRQVLERLISEKAQIQLARESGIKIEEATVDQAEANVARSNQLDVAQLRRQLNAEGMPVNLFREELRNQLLLNRLREREVEPRVRVTDLELDTFIREQQGRTDIGTQEINLGHILVAVPASANDAQVAALRDKALRIQARAKAGEDFAKLARENSDAAGAATNGGIVGRRPADRYPPLFLQAIVNLNEGGVSELIRSNAGFHLVKVIEKRRLSTMPGATVEQTHARHILLRPTAQMSEAAAVARLADFKRRVEAGQADFAALAREFSQDASNRAGGDLGWTNPGSFVPEFEEALSSLSPGQIADPLISRFGVHLVQLLERRQASLSQREQRDMVRNVLREKKLDEVYTTFVQEVRGRAFVEYRDPPQ
ncbi:MAG: peptidylprolyl isomerase [Ramlibacter sp.]|nr:peptidylprolyl isomerase [Ramlibacter sp.]